MSFTYEWRRDGSPIGTGNTYTLVALDFGTNITCAVTATNALGSTTAVTDALSIGGPTTGTGAIAAQRSAVSGIGSVFGGLVTGTGAIAAQAGDVDGTGSVTGALGVTGIGLLAAQASDVDGAGSATGAGVGLLIAQASDVDGVGTVRSSGTGVLTAQASDVDGVGLVTGAGVGVLAAQQADVDGVGTAAFASTTTVTAPNGQWWKFSGTLENGVYINGDVWVKTTTTVQLQEVGPIAPYGTGTGARHGGMINPDFNDLTENVTDNSSTNLTAMKHGWDGRVTRGSPASAYDASYNAYDGGFPITLSPGDSLISSVSNIPTETLPSSGNPVSCLTMACVTIVNSTPEADEFRPPYFGTTKTRRRFSELDTGLIPDLSAMSPYNPKGTYFEAFHIDDASVYSGDTATMLKNSYRDLQFFVYPLGQDGSLLKPAAQMWWYPRDWGLAAGYLSMYCICGFADSELFLKRIIQVAIDAYAVAEGNGFVGRTPWCAGAGFYHSPLWLIRFAGLLFDDDDMKDAVSIPSGSTNHLSQPLPKWGELQRVYLSDTAHAQYIRVPDEDYTAGFPLFGDNTTNSTPPPSTVSAGANHTGRDPNEIYDMNEYKYGLPYDPSGTNPFPDILDDTYQSWTVATVDQGPGIGTYQPFTNGQQGYVLASFAMGDEAFWGTVNPAFIPFAMRQYYDAQMWIGWGQTHDYDTAFDPGVRFYRDQYAAGGSGNQWMLTMWEEIVGIPAEPPSGDFEIVTFDGASDYLTRGADLSTIANGTEFTFVIRCNPIDNAATRVFITDAAGNFVVYLSPLNLLQMQAWGAGLYLGFGSTGVDFVNADGMQTIFVSGRTTGTPVQHCYKGDTDMLPAGTPTAGTIDFTSTNWAIGADVAGAAKFAGDVAFVWFDTRYYDVSDPDVRAMWATPALLLADGSGPGFEPKIYMTGNADVWNVGTNHALGGNFVMHGAVAGSADITPPVLSAPVATATGATTASLQVTTNEGSGTLYWVVTTNATSPSAARVKLGQDHTGAPAPDSGSQALSGSGVLNVTGGAAGLTASTAYFAYFMHEDASANQSSVATDGFTTTTPDTTAPVLSSPVATETGSTGASLTVTTDEANGTLYWVVTTSATPPSAANVKLGFDHTGSTPAADSGSQAVSSTGAQSISGGAGGLSASTAYFAYFMHEDASTNQSNVVTDGFTTTAPAGAFNPVAFTGTQYLSRSGGMTGLSDSETFTFVCRCRPTAGGDFSYRAFLGDDGGNFGLILEVSNGINVTAWGSTLKISSANTTVKVDPADGMCTIFIAGRSTSGLQALNVYQNGTDMVPASPSFDTGTIDMTPGSVRLFNINASGAWPFIGEVEFVWFDNVYYDVTSSTIRDKWLVANIGANGEGPGATPKLYMTGTASVWNAGTNLGTGGTFVMTGTVTNV